ncbi:hypothetical protein JHW43_000740 [Diplocarpon mali]|nr:hypothetical protein JHW43_000740 [Diplocarpon mali]
MSVPLICQLVSARRQWIEFCLVRGKQLNSKPSFAPTQRSNPVSISRMNLVQTGDEEMDDSSGCPFVWRNCLRQPLKMLKMFGFHSAQPAGPTSRPLVALFASSTVAGPIDSPPGDGSKRTISRRGLDLGSLMGFKRQVASTVTVPAAEAATCTPCASGSVQTITVTETASASAAIQTVTVTELGAGAGSGAGLTTTVTQSVAQTITVVQSGTASIQTPRVVTITQSASGPDTGYSTNEADGPATSSSPPSRPAGPSVVTVTVGGETSLATVSPNQMIVTITEGGEPVMATVTPGPNVVAVGSGDAQSYVTITQPTSDVQTTATAAAGLITAGSGTAEVVKTLSEGSNFLTVTRVRTSCLTPFATALRGEKQSSSSGSRRVEKHVTDSNTQDGVASTMTVPAGASQATATAGGVITVTASNGLEDTKTLSEGDNLITVTRDGRRPSVITVTAEAGSTDGPSFGRPGSGSDDISRPGMGPGRGQHHSSINVNIIIVQFIQPGHTETLTQTAGGQNMTSIVSTPPVTVTSTLTLTEGSASTALPGVQNGTATIISNSTVVLTNTTTTTLANGTTVFLNATAPWSSNKAPGANLKLPVTLNETASEAGNITLPVPPNQTYPAGAPPMLNETGPAAVNNTLAAGNETGPVTLPLPPVIDEATPAVLPPALNETIPGAANATLSAGSPTAPAAAPLPPAHDKTAPGAGNRTLPGLSTTRPAPVAIPAYPMDPVPSSAVASPSKTSDAATHSPA